MLINELLKRQEYNIYDNDEISKENIDKLAQVIFSNELDLEKIFDVRKCSNKFCWKNFLKILNVASFEDKQKCMPFVFTLLQDQNWPVYTDAIEYLLQFEDKIINPYILKFLRQAYQEDDEMWIDGIIWLAKEKYKNKNGLQRACENSVKPQYYKFYWDRISKKKDRQK